MRRSRSEAGFTLVEVLVASTVLLVGVLATITIVNAAAKANTANRQRDTATNLTRELIEAVRTVPYDSLTDSGAAGKLKSMPGLEPASGGGYTVKRNGVDYAVAIDVCAMDDARDGGGARPATATFCAESTPAGTADNNPEDYLKVTTTVTWRRNGKSYVVTQSGIASNPGSASGPAVRTITPRGYTAPYVVKDQLTTAVTVDLTTSTKPTTVNWLLDGSVQQPVPVMSGLTGLNWSFTWTIGNVSTGVLDGDYILSAEAFNEFGISGPTRQETVILNRRVPFAPRQVTGGRTSFGTVEIEWTANSERDIAGYEVRRGTTVVCAVAVQKLDTFCTDPAPPNTATVQYTVYAYDKDPDTGALRLGDPSTALNVVLSNQPPNAPTNLTASRAADGSVTLTWKRPSPQDPDSGDGVAFYRVYRDGQAVGNRYDRWFDTGPNLTWKDTATAGTTHTYSVTTVDQHYAESAYLGPVTA